MINLKEIFNGSTRRAVLITCLVMFTLMAQVQSSKIAYKKPIVPAKAKLEIKNKLNEDFKKPIVTTTKGTTVSPLAPPATTTKQIITSAETTIQDELEVAETTHAMKTELGNDEKSSAIVEDEKQQPVEPATSEGSKQNQSAATTMTDNSLEFREVVLPNENLLEDNQLDVKNVPLDWVESQERTVVEEPINFEQDSTIAAAIDGVSLENPTTSATATSITTTASTLPPSTTTTTTKTPSNKPVPCTCGVFMTSQIKRTGNPYEPPIGRPVIINELDRTYSCNAVGQKQCQTKCLETIVQHLPNSANILCASLDHDIRKERAYLFIKNCRNQWFNTNLAAGREYCCKNGQPYQCPMV